MSYDLLRPPTALRADGAPSRLRSAVAAILAAVIATTVLAAAPGARAADPYDTSAVSALITQLEADLRAQSSVVDATAVELTKGTERYEEGKVQLARTVASAEKAATEAAAARAVVVVAKERLDAVASSSYRSPMPTELDLMLSTNAEQFTNMLATASMLRLAGNNNADVLREVTVARRAAEDSTAAAERLRQAAADQEAALAAQVTSLADTAQRASDTMSATVTRLDDAQAEKARLDAARAAAEEAARQAAAEAARKAAAEAAAAAARRAAAEQDARLKAAAEALARRLAAEAAAVPTAVAPRSVAVSNGSCDGGSVSGYPNGQLPQSALCPLDGTSGHKLRADAASAFNTMTAAYRGATGSALCVTDSYRTYAAQVDVYARKPDLAAVPGTSNHGWGKAVDFCGGVQNFSSAAHQWMQANAGRFGWFHPSWAAANGSKPEPWHWEFSG